MSTVDPKYQQGVTDGTAAKAANEKEFATMVASMKDNLQRGTVTVNVRKYFEGYISVA